MSTTREGRIISTDDASRMLAAGRGYSHELNIGEKGFAVDLVYAGAIPIAKLDAFLVVNDTGFPFLLGYTRGGYGINLGFNCYIPSALERDLRELQFVDVNKTAAGESRQYRVELLHSLD